MVLPCCRHFQRPGYIGLNGMLSALQTWLEKSLVIEAEKRFGSQDIDSLAYLSRNEKGRRVMR